MRTDFFEEFGKANGRTIVGAVKIQYPVYNLHLRMLTQDVDPYYPIDRAIVKYATLQPDINFTYLSALIGLEDSFVRWRVHILMEGNMLHLNGLNYVVTDDAERKYLSKDPVRPDKTIYGNLVVDGITLDFLDASFYQNRAWLSDHKSDLLPHKPLLGVNDKTLAKTLSRLEKLSPEEKSEYCLEAASHGYVVTDFDTQTLDEVFVTFSIDNKTKESRRDILYRNKMIRIAELSAEAQKFYFSIFEGQIYNSQGFHPRQGNPFFSFNAEQIAIFIANRYSAKDIRPSDFAYCEKTDKSHPYPLTIKVTKSLLDRTKDRKRMIIDAINGVVCIPLRVGAKKNVEIGFFNIRIEDQAPEYTQLFYKMHKWEGRLNKRFVQEQLVTLPDWRSRMVYLRCYEELEDIDIDQFISYEGDR